MERPRLVASDVDGTLLGPGERVSARTASAISRVQASDIPFVLVTGRPPRWVPMIAEAAGTTGYAVCANGAVLYDIGADRVVWQTGLDPVRLADLASALDAALPGCSVATERVGTTAVSEDVQPFVAETGYRHPWRDSDHRAVTRAEVLGHQAIKLLVGHEKMTSAEMALAANALLGDEVEITYSSNSGLIEISAPNVTKASGLSDVADRFGVDAAAVIAFGDMPNDVPMLSWAGHGVAMANAHQEALDVADEVTASHLEDGVALVLERWF
ncbi:HAD family hydrolase [Umezawaea endophytica]|uniref:Cof-type HAD-IIB family hydrolase n=1 Tax=Umezawaea endophytica TaxID=1654476 RepID=A0A9X2VST4_9PSEU|nr:HAD family hydrolase [Umezawaea endophytica]MCS7482211.1 Cof-type HAD-IIB family hydrolase [Umezawaea endophytica]